MPYIGRRMRQICHGLSDSVKSFNTYDSLYSYSSNRTTVESFSPLYPNAATKQKILQWNIRGMTNNHRVLMDDVQSRNIQIVLLQEPTPQYIPQWRPKGIPFFDHFCDPHAKTMMYIHQSIRYEKIPLTPLTQYSTTNRIYGTAALVYLCIKNREQPTIILNLYRSPSSKITPMIYKKFVNQIKQWSSNKRLRQVQWIIAGDLNIKHPHWGGQPMNASQRRYGEEVYRHLQDSPFQILNNGRPTRWWISTKEELCTSHIDTTWATQKLSECITWLVQELPKGTSDHYPIYLIIKEPPLDSNITLNTDLHWSLPSASNKWKRYRTMIHKKAPTAISRMNLSVQNEQLTKLQRAEKLVQYTVELYVDTAKKLYKRTVPDVVWPRAYSKKTEQITIQYHRLYREFKQNKPHIDRKTLVKQMRYLRHQRTKSVNEYTQQYYQKKFQTNSIHERSGWAIAAEIRELHLSKSKGIPTLVNPDTSEIIATTSQDKATVLNDFYHRHQAACTLPAQYCWETEHIIHPQPTKLPEIHPKRYQEYQEEASKKTFSQSSLPKWHPTTDRTKYDAYFAKLIRTHVKKKWDRTQRSHIAFRNNTKHDYYTDMLNRPITPQEVRRTLRSFSNNKAMGPDENNSVLVVVISEKR